MKDPYTKEWVEAMRVPVKRPGGGTNCSVTAPMIKEGQEYQFRVKAKNKAGPGPPSDPSDKQVAKPRWGKWTRIKTCNITYHINLTIY